MWWTAVIALDFLVLKSNAQLSPLTAEPACPGNRVIFTCQQAEAFTRWTLTLPSQNLESSAQSSQNGSILTFVDDPGFNFEIHIVSDSLNSITTELQVIARRELNGVTVQCTGASGTFMSAIEVASVVAPSGVMATYDHFSKTGASVIVTWSTSRGADNYTIRVTPPIMPGEISEFTTTDTSLQLMVVYNLNYTINITAQNCAGSNSTVLPFEIAGCSPPPPLINGIINEYVSGSVEVMLTFNCNTGYIPHEQMTSTCNMANGGWIPIPQCVLADCGTPCVSTGVVIESFNSTQFDAVIVFHCDEGLIPDTLMETVCGANGVWNPNPAYHLCTNQSSVTCSAPIVPTNAHISNQSNGVYQEGTKVTFQCTNGSQALLTTMCYANGNWSPPPFGLDCSPTDMRKVFSRSSQIIVIAVVCSIILFLIGISVGALCHRWARVPIKSCRTLKHSNESTNNPLPTDTQAAATPVIYEEIAPPVIILCEEVAPSSDSSSGQKIELEENVAYGSMLFNR